MSTEAQELLAEAVTALEDELALGGKVPLDTNWIMRAKELIEYEYVCNTCGAPKGRHALGQSCNQNCGGRVIGRHKTET